MLCTKNQCNQFENISFLYTSPRVLLNFINVYFPFIKELFALRNLIGWIFLVVQGTKKWVKYVVYSILLLVIISATVIPTVYFRFRNKSIELTFSKHTLIGPTHASGISYTDLDLDGDIDLIGAADNFFWWENSGNGSFSYQIISSAYDRANQLEAADLDGDGDIDLVGGTLDENEIIVFQNDGTQTFSPSIVTDSFNLTIGIKLADLNGDNFVDIVACAYYDNKISWFENLHNFTFIERIVTTDLGEAIKSYPIDFDNDGDIDLVSVGVIPGEICLFMNNGTQEFTKIIIYSQYMVHGVYPIDIDLDGDIDIAGCTLVGTGSVYWFESLGANQYTKHNITTNFEGVNYVTCADIDLDGDIDILCSAADSRQLAYWENLGKNNFIKKIISSDFPGVGVFLADLDGDSDLDVISASHHPAEYVWFENIS